jgi:hypothetical protein
LFLLSSWVPMKRTGTERAKRKAREVKSRPTAPPFVGRGGLNEWGMQKVKGERPSHPGGKSVEADYLTVR